MFYWLANGLFVGAIYLGFYAEVPSDTWAFTAMLMAWFTSVPVIIVGLVARDKLVEHLASLKANGDYKTNRNVDVVFDIACAIALAVGGAYVTALLYTAHIFISSDAHRKSKVV